VAISAVGGGGKTGPPPRLFAHRMRIARLGWLPCSDAEIGYPAPPAGAVPPHPLEFGVEQRRQRKACRSARQVIPRCLAVRLARHHRGWPEAVKLADPVKPASGQSAIRKTCGGHQAAGPHCHRCVVRIRGIPSPAAGWPPAIPCSSSALLRAPSAIRDRPGPSARNGASADGGSDRGGADGFQGTL